MSRRATSERSEVGYRKPPKATQFKQGQSGNPHGRPKGTKNLKTDLIEELSSTSHCPRAASPSGCPSRELS